MINNPWTEKSRKKLSKTLREQYQLGLRTMPSTLHSQDSRKKAAIENKKNNLRKWPIGTRRKHRTSNGIYYWLIKTSASKRHWDYEHRFLIEKKIGRKLLYTEHVHHKNKNTLDNSINNLELLSAFEHRSKHFSEPRMPPDAWTKKYAACVKCKRSDRRHSGNGLCGTCYTQKRRSLP